MRPPYPDHPFDTSHQLTGPSTFLYWQELSCADLPEAICSHREKQGRYSSILNETHAPDGESHISSPELLPRNVPKLKMIPVENAPLCTPCLRRLIEA